MKKILFVDDDLDLGREMKELLSSSGYVVALAASGHEAAKMLRRQKFDLILVDYKMAGQNGIEVIRAAKKLRSGLKALLVTGKPNPGRLLTEEKAVGLIEGVVSKPFNIEGLLDRIASLL